MGCFSGQTASFSCSCQVVMGLTNIPTHKLRCRCINIVMRKEVLKGALCSNVPISTRFAWWMTQVASARFSTDRWHQKGWHSKAVSRMPFLLFCSVVATPRSWHRFECENANIGQQTDGFGTSTLDFRLLRPSQAMAAQVFFCSQNLWRCKS